MRRATSADIPQLVALMTGFYAEADFQLDETAAAAAFTTLLANESLGYVWLIEQADEPVGHMVITTRYAMEYAGAIAYLDDLYVRPSHRNRGLSTSALREAADFCRAAGIRAMVVEVGHDNGAAQTVYRRVGFTEPEGRQLLVLPLAEPAHTTY